LATCFGWTWEYIDEHMTLPRLDAMKDYWNDNPPLHQLVAAYLGHKPVASKTDEMGTLDDFVKAMGGLKNG